MTNAVSHWQLLSADPDRVAGFYSSLFGWNVSDANGLGYREVRGAGLEGGIWPVASGSPESVQLYVQVAGIDDALAKAVELGGSGVMPKQVLPDGDAMALAIDPLGRPFGLMSRAVRT